MSMHLHRFLFLLPLAVLSCTTTANAQTLRRVPGDYPSIQAAVDAAQKGDTVLVSPGTYVENVQLRGRDIVLSSRYFLEKDPYAVVRQTIIDGSQPKHPDTASCILIWKKETSATVIQGFTLTGGRGTLWFDHYVGAAFREGGGILSEFSSPTIRHNIIRHNTVPSGPGMVSYGGGGIRCGDGTPLIEGNYIVHNRSDGYGGGIVLNYCPNALIQNNILAHNYGGKDFSGGGFWATGTPGTTITLRHNTIAYNESPKAAGTYGGKGGGLFVFSIRVTLENNIFWGNRQTTGGPLASDGATLTARYNCVQGGFAGTGNLNANPLFRDTTAFVLDMGSPAIDGGNPSASAQDQSQNGQRAVFPAKGLLRPDMGAYGGSAQAHWLARRSGTLFSKVLNSPVATTLGDSRSVNWIDVDGDRDQDLMITNGPQGGQDNFLYINQGKGAFVPLTNDPIVQDGAPSDGATWADCDNDGDNDCFVVNWYGANNLWYKNKGNGTFEKISTGAAVTNGGYSETAAWGDYDNDGWLDLYVTNSEGDKRNFLYRNTGTGDLQRITTGTPTTDAFFSRCANWTDADHDGDLDLFVTNESNQSEQLYLNNAGVFTKVTGDPLVTAGGSTMSASWGDYDNDGLQDVFLANDRSKNALFRNKGNGRFEAVGQSAVSKDGSNSFGSQWADVDLDGDLDLFVTNAFSGGLLQNFFYLNQGDGTFQRDTAEQLSKDRGWSYGAAFGDADGDGDLDLAVANCYNAGQADYFYENHAAETNRHWVGVWCTGKTSNKSAIGAKVFATAVINGQTRTQMREISAQSGYCGQNQLAAHFGLGDATRLTQLVIHWPSGTKDTLRDVAADRYHSVLEGSGFTATAEPTAPIEGLTLQTVIPNPFSDSASCQFSLAQPVALSIEILDMAGRTLRQWPAQTWPIGTHTLTWDGRDAAAGTYFWVLKTASGTAIEQMMKR